MRPPSSISTSDARARRYLAVLACTLGLLLAAVASTIYVLDPFQALRPSRGTANLYGVAEYQIPGVARHFDYDAVVVGTSTSSNFRPADFARAAGWTAMNFAIDGSSIEEQRAVLDVALGTGRVRHVFWGVDPFAFRPSEGRSFPYYLYRDPGWRTAPYLVNLGALQHVFATLVTPDAKRTSLAQWAQQRNWDSMYTYGEAEVLRAWTYRDAVGTLPIPETAALAVRAVDGVMVDVMRAHPSVRFDVVLLPYSALYYKMLLEDRPWEFEAFCELDTAIVGRTAVLPNVAVYNLRDARDIVLDLGGFKDLLHFSGAVSHHVLEDVVAGRRRVTPAAFQQVCGTLRTIAAAYEVRPR